VLAVTTRPEPTLDDELARIDLSGSPIRPMRRDEFDAMAAANPYYRTRWGYTSVALLEAAKLIARDDLRTALEVGAPVKPIITGAHVMDYRFREELDPDVGVTIHDATKVPWPFEDKAFGLFIALQVFEHLGSSQVEAFREVRRVARHAILSLPIDWVMENPRNIHHMISHERVLSWFAPVTPTRVVEHMTGDRKRVVYVFEDLPAT
jgi:Methyltransferase domain